jgi:3,5-epimerase/4-reductase
MTCVHNVHYLIFGNGYLGNRFHEYLPKSIIVNQKINTLEDIRSQVDTFRPKVIIDCVGKTGKPNLDWCESNKEKTFFSNVTIPTLIAEVCKERDIYMIHIGSGSIYEGDNYHCGIYGYNENDISNSRNSFYSMTKLYSESILKYYNNILQIRIHMCVDNIPDPKNLITKLTRYEKIINIPNSITCIPDLMITAKELIDKRETGIYNVVQKGFITHSEIIQMYKELVDPDFVMPIIVSSKDLGTVVPRSGCILNVDKLESRGIKMVDVREAIKDCLIKYKTHKYTTKYM